MVRAIQGKISMIDFHSHPVPAGLPCFAPAVSVHPGYAGHAKGALLYATGSLPGRARRLHADRTAWFPGATPGGGEPWPLRG